MSATVFNQPHQSSERIGVSVGGYHHQIIIAVVVLSAFTLELFLGRCLFILASLLLSVMDRTFSQV